MAGPVCGDDGTVLQGDDGVTYTYCNSQVWLVPNGTHVAAGTALGLVGASPLGSGPSLGFEVRYPSGTPRCPQHLLTALYSNAAHGTTNPVPNPKLLSANPLSCAA